MTRVEAYRILGILWGNTRSEEEQEALSMAQNDIEFVDLMPDDMVPVVRCKDCKNFLEHTDEYKSKSEADGDCYIHKIHGGDEQFCAVGFNDFCSYGERKDNE